MNIYNCYMEKSVNGFCDVISSSMHAYCIQINQLLRLWTLYIRTYIHTWETKHSKILYAMDRASGDTKMLEIRKKKQDTKSNVESDACIIYFNIFRVSRINRFLLHPFSCLLYSFVHFTFILRHVCNRREREVFRTRIVRTDITAKQHTIIFTITDRAERLNKTLQCEKRQHYHIYIWNFVA